MAKEKGIAAATETAEGPHTPGKLEADPQAVAAIHRALVAYPQGSESMEVVAARVARSLDNYLAGEG